MRVYELTKEQKDLILGKEYAKGLKFHVVEDADEKSFISVEQVNQCNVAEFMWVKDLPTIEYKPKLVKFP